MNFLTITRELVSSERIQESEFLKGLCASVLAIHPDGHPVLPWAGYFAEEEGTLVGSCAFKTPPQAGEVEIAYFTFPDYEGRGIATRMAQWLVDIAINNQVVAKAQTLSEENASTHILKKLGFVFTGPVIHPEDGKVWEWRKSILKAAALISTAT